MPGYLSEVCGQACFWSLLLLEESTDPEFNNTYGTIQILIHRGQQFVRLVSGRPPAAAEYSLLLADTWCMQTVVGTLSHNKHAR